MVMSSFGEGGCHACSSTQLRADSPDPRTDWRPPGKKGRRVVPGGLFSSWLVNEVEPGDTVEVMGPVGAFTPDLTVPGHHVLVAAGSGITPMVSIAESVLAADESSRVTLFYGNRDSNSVIFLEGLAALKDRYLGRFELYHFLSDEEGDVELFNGMLDRETCDEALDHLVDDAQAVDAWFICGPGPMMDAAEAALTDRGVAKDRIHIERFLAGRPSAALAAQMAQLQEKAAGLTLSGRSRGRSSTIRAAGISSVAREGRWVLASVSHSPSWIRRSVSSTKRRCLKKDPLTQPTRFSTAPF